MTPSSPAQSAEIAEPAPRARETAAARSRAETRRRLLASGVRLFAERGLNGVTSHEIARGAGVATGTFYNHFPDKAALFHEIAQDTENRLRERIESAGGGGARASVRPVVEAIFDFAAENRELLRILFSGDGVAGSDLLDHFAAFVAQGRREAVASGTMPPQLEPAIVSQALVGMISRVVLWWLEDPERADREALIETMTRIQESGTHPA